MVNEGQHTTQPNRVELRLACSSTLSTAWA